MSALDPHVKACRALADAFTEEGKECGDGPAAVILLRLGAAYRRSARTLEDQIKAECTGTDGRKS